MMMRIVYTGRRCRKRRTRTRTRTRTQLNKSRKRRTRTRIRTTRWWWWWWWWWYSTTTISILQRLLWTSETSWVTTKQSEHLGGPGHTSDGAFLPAKILSKAIDFERPGDREWLPSGTPFQKIYTFFGSVFGRARVQISNVPLLKSVFFCNVKKVRSKDLIGYAAWGLPQGPAFACTLTISNKTKKQKLKKHKFCLGFLCQINIFAHAVKTQNVSFISDSQTKLAFFLVFAFLFC